MRPAAVLIAALLGTAAAADGGEVYRTRCVACHQPSGEGAPGIAPALAGTVGAFVGREGGRNYLAQVVLGGLTGPIRSQGMIFNGAMPPQPSLPDEQIAAALNYVLESFNRELLAAEHKPLTAEEIAAARARRLPMKDVRELRGRLEGASR